MLHKIKHLLNTRQNRKLKFNIAIKNKKKKELEELNERTRKRLEAALHKCTDRQVELKAETLFLQGWSRMFLRMLRL